MIGMLLCRFVRLDPRARRWLPAVASGLLWIACSPATDVPTPLCAASPEADGGGQDVAGDLAATLASCNAYCDRLRDNDCATPPYFSVDMCKSIECGKVTMLADVCVPSAKAYYDCGQALADICPGAAYGCPDEEKAYEDCFGTPQCTGPEPVGGCTDPSDGSCYPCPLTYQCDHTTTLWRCPSGTEPAPLYDCSGEPDPSAGGNDRPGVTASCDAYCERLSMTACDAPPYPSLEACESSECDSPVIDICLPSAKAFYDCGRTRADICQGVALGCPAQLKIYEDCQSGIGTMPCTSPEPSGGCTNSTEGTCYHDPTEYECDTLRGQWRCPNGTSPTPAMYHCFGSGGTSGSGGSQP